MKHLDDVELANVSGGGISTTIIGCIAVGIVFLASIIYGYIHPNKCEG